MKLFDAGGRRGQTEVVHDRVVTVANGVTLVRLLGLPLFLWLLLGADARWAAFWTLVVVGLTDWVDGYVARRFNQISRLGKLADPLVDRALMATAGVGLVLAGIAPLWVLAVIAARDVLLLGLAFALFGAIPPIPVTRVGKAATACLLVGLPGLLLGAVDWAGQSFFGTGAWVFLVLGLIGYYVAGVQYALAAAMLLRAGLGRRTRAGRQSAGPSWRAAEPDGDRERSSP